jgi:hypothetical protein
LAYLRYRRTNANNGFNGGFNANSFTAAVTRMDTTSSTAATTTDNAAHEDETAADEEGGEDENATFALYFPAKFQQKLNFTDQQFADLGILMGHDDDPKISGIGPVAAVKLLEQYNDIEHIVEAIRSGAFDYAAAASKSNKSQVAIAAGTKRKRSMVDGTQDASFAAPDADHIIGKKQKAVSCTISLGIPDPIPAIVIAQNVSNATEDHPIVASSDASSTAEQTAPTAMQITMATILVPSEVVPKITSVYAVASGSRNAIAAAGALIDSGAELQKNETVKKSKHVIHDEFESSFPTIRHAFLTSFCTNDIDAIAEEIRNYVARGVAAA